MESFELNNSDGVRCEDDYSNLTSEQTEHLKTRLKRGKKREVVIAKLQQDDLNLWNNAVKAVVERHKDELQSLADK